MTQTIKNFLEECEKRPGVFHFEYDPRLNMPLIKVDDSDKEEMVDELVNDPLDGTIEYINWEND